MVELSRQNRKAGAPLFTIDKITQDMRFKQVVIEYSFKHGVTKAAIRYKTTRQNIYRWCKRYDGTWQSLKERSHQPKHHPRQHAAQEEDLIRGSMDKAFFRYGWEGAYMEAKKAGYRRSYSGFIYAARRMG